MAEKHLVYTVETEDGQRWATDPFEELELALDFTPEENDMVISVCDADDPDRKDRKILYRWGPDNIGWVAVDNPHEPKDEPETADFIKVPILRGFTEVKRLFEVAEANNAVLCGGYARYCASPHSTPVPAGDVDIFPKDEVHVDAIVKALEDMGFEKRYENHVSITMKPKDDSSNIIKTMPTPQVIKPIIEGKMVTLGSTEEILSNFDFTIVRAAIISPDEILVDKDFMVDEEKHRMRLKNIHCPVSSLLRCCKYARKGYWMPPSEALKLFNEWMDRGDDYRFRLLELFGKSSMGEKTEDNPDGITKEDIDELEALLRID